MSRNKLSGEYWQFYLIQKGVLINEMDISIHTFISYTTYSAI